MKEFGAAPDNGILDLLFDWLVSLGMHPGWASAVNQLVGFLVIVIFIIITVLFVVLFERRIIGFFQLRLGPNRVGPEGIFQTVADALKLLQKEDLMPLSAEPVVYNLAPFVVFVPSLVSFVVIPLGAAYINGALKVFVVKDLNIGVLFILAVSSVALIGFLMAGWGSNNKYALISSIRNAAQIISYEVPMVLALLGVVLVAGSTSLVDIVQSQSLVWNIVPQFVGFLLYLICGVAETNRSPFDLPEAESELVAGFHTEYSGMKFALFFLAEYTNVFIISAIITTSFLGGWKGPMFLGYGGLAFTSVFWFLLKTYVMVYIFIWLRATLPRFRVDQLMKFAWIFLIPIAVFHVLVVGLGIWYSHPLYFGAVPQLPEGKSVFVDGAFPGLMTWGWLPGFYNDLGHGGQVFFWLYAGFALLFVAIVLFTVLKVLRGVKRSAKLKAEWASS